MTILRGIVVYDLPADHPLAYSWRQYRHAPWRRGFAYTRGNTVRFSAGYSYFALRKFLGSAERAAVLPLNWRVIPVE